jgi:hypothetical protein
VTDQPQSVLTVADDVAGRALHRGAAPDDVRRSERNAEVFSPGVNSLLCAPTPTPTTPSASGAARASLAHSPARCSRRRHILFRRGHDLTRPAASSPHRCRSSRVRRRRPLDNAGPPPPVCRACADAAHAVTLDAPACALDATARARARSEPTTAPPPGVTPDSPAAPARAPRSPCDAGRTRVHILIPYSQLSPSPVLLCVFMSLSRPAIEIENLAPGVA